MASKLRKTLSDRVVKRFSQIMDRSRPSSAECSDTDTDYSDNETIGEHNSTSGSGFICKLRPKTPSFIRRQRKSSGRRVTVTGCNGRQIVNTRPTGEWYYNDRTETTVDRNGVKTTSFCASDL